MNVLTVIRPDGTRETLAQDLLHNEDGPAVVRPDGTREWWQFGVLCK